MRAFRKYSLENEQRRIRERDPNPPYIEWYLRASQEEFEEYVGRADLAVRELWMDYYDADVALHPEWPSSQFKTKLMRAVVERMRDACARRGVAMLALIVPSAVDLSPKCTIRVDPARYPTWSPSRLTDALESITTELGVAHVNLYEPFRAAGPDGLYIGDGLLRPGLYSRQAVVGRRARTASSCPISCCSTSRYRKSSAPRSSRPSLHSALPRHRSDYCCCRR